jgi:hypothetical protein
MLASGFEAHNNFGVAEVAGSNPASPTTKPGPWPPHGASRAAAQLSPLPVRGEPLSSAEHSEQRPDRLGDWLERLVVRSTRPSRWVVSVSIDGRSMPALSDYTGSGQQLQQRVLAIVGVRWPYPPGTPPGRAG